MEKVPDGDDVANANFDGFYMDEDAVKNTPKNDVIHFCIQYGIQYKTKTTNKVYSVGVLRKKLNKHFSNMKIAAAGQTIPSASATPNAAAAAATSVETYDELRTFVEQAIQDWADENQGGRWPPTLGNLTSAESDSGRQNIWNSVDQDMLNDILCQFVSDPTNHAELKNLGFHGLPKTAD